VSQQIHKEFENITEPENTANDESETLEKQDHPETEDASSELMEVKDKLLRIQAEMQNVRRRAQRDLENAHKFALDKFVSALLPVVDNLDRAVDIIDEVDEAQRPVADGLKLTLKSFLDVLTQFHVEQVDPSGVPFDAELHQAVSTVQNSEVEPNTVIDVYQKGYVLNGRLVRPAMVTVAKV
tara:strand:+ start:494 stop:1039 length:546 start_codon:yes stop_codon:yes gene_type:complete